MPGTLQCCVIVAEREWCDGRVGRAIKFTGTSKSLHKLDKTSNNILGSEAHRAKWLEVTLCNLHFPSITTEDTNIDP
jgi:hypothetical protein